MAEEHDKPQEGLAAEKLAKALKVNIARAINVCADNDDLPRPSETK